ncbi:hypothetical protein ABZT45_36445 [Streptomyces sp. NPDC005356]|uniref:hypothetical protein n=1 Tax=Streptomyces sp. NPDC005356 TaxID=3157167 RepID=UPI0033ABC31D
MNGYEHYQRAEELSRLITEGRVNDYNKDAYATLAQAHATLALAAATADTMNFQRDLYAGNGLESPAKVTRKRAAAAKSTAIADDFLGGAV